jgi:hypothetical protein
MSYNSTWPGWSIWASHIEGIAHGQAKLSILKDKLMVKLSWACWKRNDNSLLCDVCRSLILGLLPTNMVRFSCFESFYVFWVKHILCYDSWNSRYFVVQSLVWWYLVSWQFCMSKIRRLQCFRLITRVMTPDFKRPRIAVDQCASQKYNTDKNIRLNPHWMARQMDSPMCFKFY